MTTRGDPLASAEHNARVWLSAIAEGLGTEDRHAAYRALRAWLHVVRDRLSVNASVHLGSQLPVLLRGVYFEDWTPNATGPRPTPAEFTAEFARTAGIGQDESIASMASVTSVLRARFSPGQMEHALAQLPQSLRAVLSGAPADAPAVPAVPAG